MYTWNHSPNREEMVLAAKLEVVKFNDGPVVSVKGLISGLVIPIGNKNPERKPQDDNITNNKQSREYVPVFLKISIPVDQNGSTVANERSIGFSLSFFAMSV